MTNPARADLFNAFVLYVAGKAALMDMNEVCGRRLAREKPGLFMCMTLKIAGLMVSSQIIKP